MTDREWEQLVIAQINTPDDLITAALIDGAPVSDGYIARALTPELVEVAMCQYTDDLVGSFKSMTVPVLSRFRALRRILE